MKLEEIKGTNEKVNFYAIEWPFENTMEWDASMNIAKNSGVLPGVVRLCELTTHSHNFDQDTVHELVWTDGSSVPNTDLMLRLAWIGARAVFVHRCLQERVVDRNMMNADEIRLMQVTLKAMTFAMQTIQTVAEVN